MLTLKEWALRERPDLLPVSAITEAARLAKAGKIPVTIEPLGTGIRQRYMVPEAVKWPQRAVCGRKRECICHISAYGQRVRVGAKTVTELIDKALKALETIRADFERKGGAL